MPMMTVYEIETLEGHPVFAREEASFEAERSSSGTRPMTQEVALGEGESLTAELHPDEPPRLVVTLTKDHSLSIGKTVHVQVDDETTSHKTDNFGEVTVRLPGDYVSVVASADGAQPVARFERVALGQDDVLEMVIDSERDRLWIPELGIEADLEGNDLVEALAAARFVSERKSAPRLSPKKLKRLLKKKQGCTVDHSRGKGSHGKVQTPSGRVSYIPFSKETMGVDLLKRILKPLGLTVADLA